MKKFNDEIYYDHTFSMNMILKENTKWVYTHTVKIGNKEPSRLCVCGASIRRLCYIQYEDLYTEYMGCCCVVNIIASCNRSKKYFSCKICFERYPKTKKCNKDYCFSCFTLYSPEYWLFEYENDYYSKYIEIYNKNLCFGLLEGGKIWVQINNQPIENSIEVDQKKNYLKVSQELKDKVLRLCIKKIKKV